MRTICRAIFARNFPRASKNRVKLTKCYENSQFVVNIVNDANSSLLFNSVSYRICESTESFLIRIFFLIETVIIKKRLSMIKVLFVILLYQTTGFKLLDFDITHYLTDVELTLYSTSTTTTKKKRNQDDHNLNLKTI